jgi:putative Holliday junction resolvase
MPGRLLALSSEPAPLDVVPDAGTVLAFDFGEKRIGVAVGELEVRIPHAVTVIPAEPKVERYREAQRLVDEWRPVLFAVGLPSRADGSQHYLSPLCRKFARSLEGRFGIPVLLVDERLSSASASAALNEVGIRGGAQKAHLDATAAAEILATLFSEIDAAA